MQTQHSLTETDSKSLRPTCGMSERFSHVLLNCWGNLLQTYYSSAASFVLPGKCFTLFSDLSKFTPELLKTGSVVLPLVFELTLRCENGE